MDHVAVPGALLHWVSTTDHKEIGLLYLATTTFFLLVGGLEALLMRVQLAVPRNTFLSADAYDALFTMHGTTMIFLVVMPMLFGFANYFVPLMIGARDMAFPKLNALSFWLLLFGGILLNFSYFTGSIPNQGWFSYAPLTEHPFALDNGIDYWILGLLVTSFGSIATGLNLIVTIAKLRVPDMTAFRMPVFVWMSLVTGFLAIWAIPSLTAAQFLLLFDRYLGTHFFQVSSGGNAILWQHLFWYFGHPEVYIMALPAFGMISEIIPVFSRKPLFGYPVVVASGIAIAFLSFGVWAHHMFTVGLGDLSDTFFALTSMTIAVPTGVKVFNWLATMWGGRIRFTTAMKFATGFLALFTIGGITGVQFAVFPVDWELHDTYYVVAHFHYVLFGGSYFALSAAAYYWSPKMTGRLLDERLGNWHFWLTFIGFNVTFFPMHLLGLMGMSRRVYTYPDLPGWAPINFLETIGAFILAASVLVLLANIVRTLRHGQIAGDNPWNGWTLEWATTSPPPAYNFVTVPPVRSARPLWDLSHPGGRSDEAESRRQLGGPPVDAAALPGAKGVGSFFEQVSIPVLGTIVFISSEVIFFGSLIATFIVLRDPGSGFRANNLDVPRTALFSLALFASSGTIIWAERRLRQDDVRGFLVGLLATIVLGLIFLAGQGTEYARLVGDGITPSTNSFTSGFFTLTGFHGLHVVVGTIALAIVAGLTFAGEFRNGKHHVAVEAVSIYWHFVDAVWVVVFTIVYLWGLIG